MIVERKVYKEKILNDLNKKMVLIAGPRQVGKTFLAKEILKKFPKGIYLNYDLFEHREIIKRMEWLEDTELIVFDELHKMPDWKNYLKGIYDTKRENLKILITGSARLDFFRQTGDSLTGRYFLHHLFPLTLSELKQDDMEVKIDRFFERGCFPETFLSEDLDDVARWRNQYVDTILREEVFSLEKVDKLKELKLVFEILRRRVGSPVSYKSIAEDVQVSPNTVKRYISILENLYLVFRIPPFAKNIARAVLKEPKIYFFDPGLIVGDKGVVFENFVAMSLYKHATTLKDFKGKDIELRYLRTKDKKEIDFCLVENEIPQLFIEVKLSDREIAKNLRYFSEKYNVKGIQVVKNLRTEYQSGNIKVLKGENFLKSLFL